MKNKDAYEKNRRKLKNKVISHSTKMPKSNNQPPPRGRAQAKLREYYSLVLNPPEEQNQEKY